jgi:CubicO group peptidase (beta-lactamase class C family)
VGTPDMASVAATGSHPLLSWQTPLLPFLFDDWQAFIRETVDQRMWFNRFYADSDPPTGLMGSTDDLARFLIAFLDGGEYQGRRVLSEATVALMSTESIMPVLS